ncbi:MAG: UDP-N-acetylglucosamine 1-carboxyvinyltransferase [Caldithrix sp.]|nr:MAG: UDP-N-acetylglucosamine 1-carboxyvinyltransferase [Caldithrix sp.]
MDKIVINGGKRLKGQVKISGAKNAALPIMAATLLASGNFEIHNVPDLRDVKTMAHLLRIIGAQVDFANNSLRIDTCKCNFYEAPYELVKTMRASIYVLAPLLARFLEARVSLPGGCALGSRPVDLHLKGLEKLGAKIHLKKGYIFASAKRLTGASISFAISSVGATGNILMAAVLAQGRTVIENASYEPEITALAEFLVKMGANIEGIGTGRLTIRGVDHLNPVEYTVIPDRIETGTYLMAAAITGGEVELTDTDPKIVTSLVSKLRDCDVLIEEADSKIYCKAPNQIKPVGITTAPYPGFPTDLQAQWMTLMCVANGSSIITDTIFADRFTHVAELRRLGAEIKRDKSSAVVAGTDNLNGAPVMSTDLRAGASLVLAGLKAQGRTDVLRVYHIDRGYEKIEEKLKLLGADIWREEGEL